MLAVLTVLTLNFLPVGCSESDSLTVRNAHGMVYDSDRDVVLLYGGADEMRVLSDLWAWDGTTWRCLAAGGPPARTFPAMAYDPISKNVVLFGGNRVLFGTESDTASFLNDMWSWDGQEWRELDVEAPSPRAEAATTYRSDARRIVLFGGYRNEGANRIRLGDTWEWDGKAWVLKTTMGPSPRNGAAVAYDGQRKRVVLFGGSGAMDETWEWDGSSWSEVASAPESGRFNAAMAYDPARGLSIRSGGWSGDGRADDTWAFDGQSWVKLNVTGPSPRNHTVLVYHSKRESLLLFGGHDGDRVLGDLWELKGSGWAHLDGREPRLRVDNGH